MSNYLDDDEFVTPLDEDSKAPWKAGVSPSNGGGPARGKAGQLPQRKRRQYRLNQLMLASVWFAFIFFVIGKAVRSGDEEDILLAGMVIGLSLTVLGSMLLFRGTRRSWLGKLNVMIGLVSFMTFAVGWFSVVLAVILLMSISHIAARYRSMQQDALLWSIALAADRAMPLAPAVEAFSKQLGWAYRRKGRNVADCLQSGMALPDALEFVDRSATPPAIVLARVGWDAGALPQALRMATTDRLARGRGSQDLASRIAYLSTFFIAMQLIVAFIMYFIMPKFEAIFRDFGLPFPPITIAVIEASHMVMRFGLGPVVLIVEIALLAYLPFAINGWGSLSVPFIDRFFIGRHRILILKALSVVVEAGQPLAMGVLSLSRSYPTRWVRTRLEGAWKAIEGGHGWADSLRSFGLLTPVDAEVLCSAERVGNLPWAVQELAVTSDRRQAIRLQFLSQLFFILAILAAGFLVALLAVAYFTPLVQLITRLSR